MLRTLSELDLLTCKDATKQHSHGPLLPKLNSFENVGILPVEYQYLYAQTGLRRFSPLLLA